MIYSCSWKGQIRRKGWAGINCPSKFLWLCDKVLDNEGVICSGSVIDLKEESRTQ